MSLRKKTLYILSITLVSLTAVLYLAASQILIKNYQTMEISDAGNQCRLFTGLIDNELDQLLIKAGDWAVWDDTYTFVENLNRPYIVSNLNENALSLLKINFMFFINRSGRIVYSIAYDIESEKIVEPPREIQNHLDKIMSDLPGAVEKEGIQGFIRLKSGTTLMAARPILDSMGQGPSKGILIWGVYLNQSMMKKISGLTKLNSELYDFHNSSPDFEIQNAKKNLSSKNPVYIKPLTGDTLAAYNQIDDIYGNPAALIRLKIKRDLYSQGIAGIRYIFISIVITGTVFGFIIFYIMHKMVILPATDLSREVKAIGQSGDPGRRVLVRGTDEFSSLAGTINMMLESIENVHLEKTRTEERLTVTLKSIADGVIATDKNGLIELMNPAAQLLTGWSEKEAAGLHVDEVFKIINENDRTPCESSVNKVLFSGTKMISVRYLLLIGRNDFETVIAESGAPIIDSNGKVSGIVIVFKDISDTRKIQEEMLRNQKLESIQSLAGGIAHDFNNILMGIISNISLLKVKQRGGSDNQEILREAESACFRARDLTYQLLTFSKGGSPVRKNSSIAELLKETATFALRGSNVSLKLDIPENLWSVDIDEGQIHQVINNLIINADQAMSDGGLLTVSAENVTIKNDSHLSEITFPHIYSGHYVRLRIRDTGIGINNDNLRRVFDPYFTTKPDGNGLGLSIVYSIIKNHDGYIDIESEPDKGTVFYVYLPSDGTIPEKKSVNDRKLPKGKGKLLIMDDDIPILKSVSKMVAHLGYSSDTAPDGVTAVSLYKKSIDEGNPYTAVIMDLTIPGGMGGKETIKVLLELDPSIKALVSSGYSNDPVLSNYREFGFIGVISKPYSIEDLAESLSSILSK